jgi:hypothetical protein
MEKHNVVEKQRTPCKSGSTRFCECPDCTFIRSHERTKEAEAKPASIDDVEALARIHK